MYDVYYVNIYAMICAQAQKVHMCLNTWGYIVHGAHLTFYSRGNNRQYKDKIINVCIRPRCEWPSAMAVFTAALICYVHHKPTYSYHMNT